MKIIKRGTVSNCLLFCLILKLKYGGKVKVRRTAGILENWRKYGVPCAHFYISHGAHDWHFTTDKALRFPQYYGLFRGFVKVY